MAVCKLPTLTRQASLMTAASGYLAFLFIGGSATQTFCVAQAILNLESCLNIPGAGRGTRPRPAVVGVVTLTGSGVT